MSAAAAPTVRVLLTEDVAADAELEVRELKRAGMRIAHRVVDSEESFDRALRDFAPDVILSDFSMPGFDGMSALAIARERAPDTPFIFVSGTIGEEYAIRALKNGATDYVLKTNLVRLPAAVERALAEAAERREKRRTEAELEIARERLTSIFTALPDMLWSLDAQTGEHIYVSPAAHEIFGRAPEEFLSNRELWKEIIVEEDRAAVLAAWARVPAGAEFDVEYRIRRPDGGIRWVSDRARLIRGAGGAPERIDGLARDITEQVEQRLRIERLSRIRELLGFINSLIVRTRERRTLFDEFCRIAVSLGGFVLARVIEVDALGKATLTATTESDASTFRAMLEDHNADPQNSHSLFGRALRSGSVVISNDVASDVRASPRSTAFTRKGNYALAILPMVVDGRMAGLVSLRAKESGYFDQEEMQLLQEMVANISFALELMDKQARISYLGLYDMLTDLPNRALFGERLGQAVASAGADRRRLGLLLVDLERFKAINDTFGSAVGDRVLRAVADRLREVAGDVNRVARLGGNLFAYFTRIGTAEDVARGIEHTAVFAKPFRIDEREITLSTKTGIAIYPDDGGDADSLYRNAEAALKRAKETGERYLYYAPEINARVSELVELESRLRKAVDNGEIHLHYQPKLELATRRLVGLEALMRWTGPDGGFVSPGKFVPVLEQTGLILEAGRQAIARASRAWAQWRARGLAAPRIAVNVSALQLRRRSFVEDVKAALVALEDGGGVDLEITESLLMSEVEDSMRKLHELRALGMRVALDDFGTGYSSLAYLSKLPVDSLKIDRAFVHGMTANADDTSIVSSIISLAQALRLKVVAEGVETEQQAQLLRLLRCDEVQGFLFSPPLPPDKIELQLKAL